MSAGFAYVNYLKNGNISVKITALEDIGPERTRLLGQVMKKEFGDDFVKISSRGVDFIGHHDVRGDDLASFSFWFKPSIKEKYRP